MTGFLPSFWGLAIATTISSLGFHYFEAVNQSLQLQWLSKERAPQMIGILRGVAAVVGFIVFAALIWWGFVAREEEGAVLDYRWPYLSAGVLGILIIVVMIAVYPKFEGPTVQRRDIVLKRRYWLYYALVFMGGARRQIFMVFAAFMLVEKFGYAVHETATLLLVNHVATMIAAPVYRVNRGLLRLCVDLLFRDRPAGGGGSICGRSHLLRGGVRAQNLLSEDCRPRGSRADGGGGLYH